MNYEFIPAKCFSYGWRKQPNLIVIHWIAGSAKSAINIFKNGTKRNSAHFIVDIDGTITQMVKLGDRAWHAGVSSTKQFGQYVNEYSYGIELAGPPSCIGTKKWNDIQIIETAKLVNEIAEKIPTIKYITDHSTISPGRKIDVKAGTGKPEDVFPWCDLMKLVNIKEL